MKTYWVERLDRVAQELKTLELAVTEEMERAVPEYAQSLEPIRQSLNTLSRSAEANRDSVGALFVAMQISAHAMNIDPWVLYDALIKKEDP